MSLLLVFIILNILNVIIQTVKSIMTIKGTKWSAAFFNALAYGFYTVVVVYMMCDLPLYLKALIVALCNLIGVYVVKWLEEKRRKDKVWKIEATATLEEHDAIHHELEVLKIPHNYVLADKWVIFNIYAATQKESHLIHEVIDRYDVKYFISETKTF